MTILSNDIPYLEVLPVHRPGDGTILSPLLGSLAPGGQETIVIVIILQHKDKDRASGHPQT